MIRQTLSRVVAYQSFKHKAWVLLMVINSIVDIAFVVCYSRFDIEVNSFIEALTEWSLM